jgi:hypothetical protein
VVYEIKLDIQDRLVAHLSLNPGNYCVLQFSYPPKIVEIIRCSPFSIGLRLYRHISEINAVMNRSSGKESASTKSERIS